MKVLLKIPYSRKEYIHESICYGERLEYFIIIFNAYVE